jgi:hypothetical protein
MQDAINEIKYEMSVGFLRSMMRQEKLTLEQAQTAERYLRKTYGVIIL